MKRRRPRISLARQTAQLLGDRSYVGPACTCGCTEFYTINGSCVECTKAAARKRFYDTADPARMRRNRQHA